MNKKEIKVPFKELTITCDGEHTHIIADGEELGSGCSSVYFMHETSCKGSVIRLTKTIDLVPEEREPASGN